MMNITTARLTLKPLTDDDSAFILELVNSPLWVQHIGERNITTTQHALTYIHTLHQNERTQGYSLYKICLLQNNTPIGLCGFVKRDYLNQPDLGYAILPDYMRKGYTFENCSSGYTLC